MNFKDDNPRLKAEFTSFVVSPLLRAVALDLAWMALHTLKNDLTITAVLRTAQEQVEQKVKSDFQHCVGGAVDIRSRNLQPNTLDRLISYAIVNWEEFCTLRLHTKGTAPHFHLALTPKYSNREKIFDAVSSVTDGQKYWTG